MNKLMQHLVQILRPSKRLSTQQKRDLLERDPGLKMVRQEQRDIEHRLKRLEVQARVRARRN